MADERIVTALLPPLWGIVVGYADRVEQMMLVDLAVFAPHIKPWVDYLHDDGGTGSFDEELGASGHVVVAQWCMYQPVRFPQLNWISIRNVAISGGHIELVRWIMTHKNSGQLPATVRASPGQMPALSEDAGALLFAAEAGQIAMIAFLQEHGCVCNGTTALGAAGHSLETLQAVHASLKLRAKHAAASWPRGMYGMAASSGDVRTIEYIANEGYPDPNKYCVIEALENAETPQMLEALVEYLAVPLDNVNVCATYAERGDVGMLEAARAHGFAWNCATTHAAIAMGHWAMFMWLVENGCPWDESTRSLIQSCVSDPPSPAVVAWRRRRRRSYGPRF